MSQTNPNSPFNWQGTPSIFLKSQDHNGVNHANSQRLAKMKKTQPVHLTGSGAYVRAPERQMTTYSKAKAK